MDGVLREFDNWMNGAGAWHLLLVSLVLTPVLTLVHELGHATVALLRTDGPVLVKVGWMPKWERRFGRLVVCFGWIPEGIAGYAARTGRLTRRERVAELLAGPAAQAVASIVLLAVPSTAVRVVAGLGLVTAVLNLVPQQWGRWRSDGAHLRDALRRSAGLDETWPRARALAADNARNLTPRRQALCACAAVALGHAPDDRGPEALELARIAYLGWCWRAAEHDDPAGLRQATLAAFRRAAATGAREPQLTALAANELARSSLALGLHVDAAGPTDERQRFAFRFGAALRAVEAAT
jgi:hypothetical protein